MLRNHDEQLFLYSFHIVACIFMVISDFGLENVHKQNFMEITQHQPSSSPTHKKKKINKYDDKTI